MEAGSNQTSPEMADRLVYDPDLDQEIIYFATPLRKQIRVEPGTKVDEFKDDRGIRTAGNGVFVEGEFEADDVFCASWSVVIVTAAAFLFLQFCILVVCVLCIFASRRVSKDEYEEDRFLHRREGGVPSTLSHPSERSAESIYGAYVPHRTFSPSLPGTVNTAHYVRSSNHSPMSTLKSLRTSYRE
eukprot:maker-scaffold367_size194084-snap-gene-0.40 protein:Tk00500 transcript:maker-scaffold367_size194084-snap-gene-0.40-mRNA-1 annotation:"---NA---"